MPLHSLGLKNSDDSPCNTCFCNYWLNPQRVVNFRATKCFWFFFVHTTSNLRVTPSVKSAHFNSWAQQFSSIYIASNPNTNQLKVLYIVKTLQWDSVHEHLCSILICLYSSVTAVGFLRHQRLRTREHNLSNPSGDKTPLGCERCGSPIKQQNQEEGI